MCALVLTAVASQGCFDGDEEASAGTPAAVPADQKEQKGTPASSLTNEELVAQIRATAKIVADVRKEVDADNQRMARELARIAPALTPEHGAAFTKAFFEQAGPAARQVKYAESSSTLGFLLHELLSDEDRLADLAAGGIDGFNHQDFYDAYKALAVSPAAEGALAYVHYLGDEKSGLDHSLIPGGTFNLAIIKEILVPALCNAAVQEFAKDPKRDGVDALKALRERLGLGHSVVSLSLDTVIELEKGQLVPQGTNWKDTSLDDAVKGGALVLGVWEFREGIDSARAGDYRAAFEAIAKGGTDSLKEAMGAYEMLVGASRTGKLAGVAAEALEPIAAGLGIAFGVIATIEGAGDWNGDPSEKAKVLSSILSTVAGCATFLELGPAGVVLSALAITANVASLILEAREAARDEKEEREQARTLLVKIDSQLYYRVLSDPLTTVNTSNLLRFRDDIFADKQRKAMQAADAIQWTAWASPSSFGSSFLTGSKREPTSHTLKGIEVIKGLVPLKTRRSQGHPNVEGLLHVVGSGLQGLYLNDVIFDFLSRTDSCFTPGPTSICRPSLQGIPATWDHDGVVQWIHDMRDENCTEAAGYCTAWKTALENAENYLKDGTLPDGYIDPPSPADPTDPINPKDPPTGLGKVNYTFISWAASGYMECQEWLNAPIENLGGKTIGQSYSTGGALVSSISDTSPGEGAYAAGTACPPRPKDWTGGCCVGTATSGNVRSCVLITAIGADGYPTNKKDWVPGNSCPLWGTTPSGDTPMGTTTAY